MEEQRYIKINAIYQKIKQAVADQSCIYIHAPVGTGKTAAVRYYFRDCKCRWLSGKLGFLPDRPDVSQVEEPVIIIDDISWLTDAASQQYICQMVEQTEKQIVLIGRNRMPKWLMNTYTSGYLRLADERYMLMDQVQIQRLMKSRGCTCSEEEAEQMLKDTAGFVLELIMIARHFQREGCYNRAVLEDAKLDCYHYYDQMFFEHWNTDVQEMLLSVVEFDQFDAELAQLTTRDSSAPALLEYAYGVGDFLIRNTDGSYSLRPQLREFLRWRRDIKWSEAAKRDIHKNAAVYYELHDNIPAALKECRKIGDEKQILELLVKNAERHTGVAHYYETKEYYFSLPEEKILEYPVLIAGMSMLYSLILQPEKSEEWYQKLCSYVEEHQSLPRRQKEAKSRIAYLDIALPHRGVGKMSDTLKSVARLCIDRSISMPEFSVTSNIPSVMNGGKDFCDWSRIDKELAKVMRKPIEIVLGEFGVGLVNIALAESYFEKSSADDFEVITLAGDGYAMAETKGRIEMCFAALGTRTRLNVRHDHLRLAEQQLGDFKKRVIKEHAEQLLPNIEALRTWLNLKKGNMQEVREWMRQAPSELEGFYILDRYQYLMKLRCYLVLGEYEAAWNLADRLTVYFTQYERHYMQMETTLLRAILCYRMGRKEWKNHFQTAYEQAESYHFTWLIAQEGIAVRPLLKEWSENHAEPDEFWRLVREKTEKMAFQYPAYLAEEKVLAVPLSDMEKRILQMHCAGVDSRKIQELCDIKERTLKFHNANIYKKLGVKNKSEAIIAAKQLDIVN